jgi:hypothetical protein
LRIPPHSTSVSASSLRLHLRSVKPSPTRACAGRRR